MKKKIKTESLLGATNSTFMSHTSRQLIIKEESLLKWSSQSQRPRKLAAQHV